MSTVIDTPEGITFFKLLQMRGALAIQISTGLTHSQGSIWKLAKETYGLKGSLKSVHQDLCQLVEEIQLLRERGVAVVDPRELAAAMGLNDDDTEGVRLLPLTQDAADALDRGEMPA